MKYQLKDDRVVKKSKDTFKEMHQQFSREEVKSAKLTHKSNSK